MVLKGEPAWVCLMCCNADVLFSVIVLHWVTSKDSSSTASTGRSHSTDRDQHTSRNTHSIGNKLGGSFNFSSKQQPTVTTHISAIRKGDDEEEREIQRMDWNRGGGSKEAGRDYPMGKIRVQVGQVVEIESDAGRGSEASTMHGEDLSRARSNRSSEDLVDKKRPVVS